MKSRIISLLLLSATLISYNALAEHRGYVGVSGGLSLPLKSKFSIKDDGQTFDTKVKKSNMATVALGYNLGDGVAIEFGVDFKPKYPMKVMLPNNLSLDTKAVANIYMLSVVYDFAKVGELDPYFVAGIGLGDIRIKGGSVNSGALKVFELNKAHRTALAFQLGIGARYPLNHFIALDVATKIQGITNVKMKYKKFDTATGQLKDKSTKQHLGVAELVAGFVFKF